MRAPLLVCTLLTAPLIACGGSAGDGDAKVAKTGTPPAAGEKAGALPKPETKKLQDRAKRDFGTLPEVMKSADNELTDDKIALGRQLYYDTRLSKNHDVSCETCHALADYGVDGQPTSTGHKGQKGDRNAPTVYNAGLQLAQFWDGRAATLEEQAVGPLLNPIEHALPDEAAALAVINSIPAYKEAFTKVFPDDGVTYANIGKAIGAFERKLVTPGPFDKFVAGDEAAISEEAQQGLQLFYDAACITCHTGPGIGGGMFQKLGNVKPYETEDEGRFKHTGVETDKFIFKVPLLRNIAKTGPYLHDGSIATLDEMVDIMVKHQTIKGSFSPEEKKAMLAFLDSLTGEIPADYIKKPELPESGPDTPKPDPT